MVLFGNKVVTVFNKHFDAITEEETWIPTVLNNVNLSITRGANVEKTGLESADTCKLFVDSTATEKSYIAPIEWNKKTFDEKSNFYTFGNEDFFVEGDLSEVTILDTDGVTIKKRTSFNDDGTITLANLYKIDKIY